MFFLSQRTGRWRWVWLLVSFPAGLLAAIVAILALFLALEAGDAIGFDSMREVSDWVFAETAIASVTTNPVLFSAELFVLGGSLWVAAAVASLVHGRSVRSLVAPLGDFDWSIVRRVLALQAGLTVAAIPLQLTLPWLDQPGLTSVGLDDLAWLVPLAALTLVQTSGEDVFFKGYLLRHLGAATGAAWFAPVVVVVGFVSLHLGNADLQAAVWILLPLFVISEMMIIYFVMRTGGMEVALSWHWFNNVTIFLLVAERTTQANDVTLFVFDEDPTTIADDAVTGLLYAAFLVIQLVAFTWRRSPFFLEPRDWTQTDLTVDEDSLATPERTSVPSAPWPPPAIASVTNPARQHRS